MASQQSLEGDVPVPEADFSSSSFRAHREPLKDLLNSMWWSESISLSAHNPLVKDEFPYFSNYSEEDPLAFIEQCEEYFAVCPLTDEEMIAYTANAWWSAEKNPQLQQFKESFLQAFLRARPALDRHWNACWMCWKCSCSLLEYMTTSSMYIMQHLPFNSLSTLCINRWKEAAVFFRTLEYLVFEALDKTPKGS